MDGCQTTQQTMGYGLDMRVSTAFGVRLWVVKHLINWVHSIIHHQSPHYKHLQVKNNDWRRIMILLQCNNLLGNFGSRPFTVKGCYWPVVYSPPKNPKSWPDLQIVRSPIQLSIYGMHPTPKPPRDSVPVSLCLVAQGHSQKSPVHLLTGQNCYSEMRRDNMSNWCKSMMHSSKAKCQTTVRRVNFKLTLEY